MGKLITVAGVIPLAIGVFAAVDPHSTTGRIGITALGLGILVIAVAIHARPVVPVIPAPVPASVPTEAPEPQARPAVRRPGSIDLNPPMPDRVADEDMPAVRIAERRQMTREHLAEIDRVRNETRDRTLAEEQDRIERELPALLDEHMSTAIAEALSTQEGRDALLAALAEAEARQAT